MSDIAMLVAEEYERRVKNSRKAAGGGGGGDMEINWVSCASVMAQRIKNKITGNEKMEFLKLVLEPKSQMSLAASNGFFSA